MAVEHASASIAVERYEGSSGTGPLSPRLPAVQLDSNMSTMTSRAMRHRSRVRDCVLETLRSHGLKSDPTPIRQLANRGEMDSMKQVWPSKYTVAATSYRCCSDIYCKQQRSRAAHFFRKLYPPLSFQQGIC